MTEQELKELLCRYQDRELDRLDQLEAETEEHEFSQKFHKKMERLFWTEKYFGHQVRLGYMVRKVAAVAAVSVGVLLAGTVSAKVFHFDPWTAIFKPYQKHMEPGGNAVTGSAVYSPDESHKLKPSHKPKEKPESVSVKDLSDEEGKEAEEKRQEIGWDSMESQVKEGAYTYTYSLSKDSKHCWIKEVELDKKAEVDKNILSLPKEIDGVEVIKLGRPGEDGLNYNLFGVEVDVEAGELGETVPAMENLRVIDLPNTLSSFENCCFAGFEKLEMVNLSQKVKNLPKKLFYKTYTMQDFGLTDGNEDYYGANHFVLDRATSEIIYAPKGLETMEVPKGVKTLDKYLLRNSKVTKITIPDSVTRIEDFALDGPALTEIVVGINNDHYHMVENCLTTADEKTLVAAVPKSGTIRVPGTVRSIGDGISVGSRSELSKVIFHKKFKRLKKGWQSICTRENPEKVTLIFKCEPPKVDSYYEYTMVDEKGKTQTYLGSEMTLKNKVKVRGVDLEAYRSWVYGIARLSSLTEAEYEGAT
ncbi:MAG: leucine-rich repeat domain-containing protein, partial [Eubacterium sp.]|nr:leucine-rich repeat domain-containing protein [Eubacterium sp.]